VQRFLVGLYREEVIGSQLLYDQAGRFLVGVQGIQNHDFASQVVALINPLQERARGPDLVGFVRRSHRPQPPSALRSNGTDQLASLCMEQFFAIDGNNAILHRTQHLILPSQERQLLKTAKAEGRAKMNLNDKDESIVYG
jgi:hypothetical protein